MHRPRGRIGHVDRQALRTGLGAHGGSQINPADHVARTGLVVAMVPLIARLCAKGSGSIFLNLAAFGGSGRAWSQKFEVGKVVPLGYNFW